MKKFTTKILTALLLLQWLGLGLSFAQEKDGNFIFYLLEADAQIHEREMYQPDHNLNFAEMQLLEDGTLWKWNDYTSRPAGFMAMAQNERTGFQVFFREQEKERNLRIVVSPFINSESETLPHTIYNEEFFYFSGVYNFNDSLAEALIPYSGAPIKTTVGHNKVFYVELLSSKIQTPGYYTSNVSVYDGDQLLQTKPVTIKVWNFALPESHYSEVMMGLYNRNSGYNDTRWLFLHNNISVDASGSVSEADKPAALELLRSYQEFLLEHGVNTFEIPRWLIDEDPKAAELTMADPRRKNFSVPVHGNDLYGTSFSQWGLATIAQYKDLVYNNEFLKDKAFFYPVDEIKFDNSNEDNDKQTRLNNFCSIMHELWPDYHAVSPFNSNYNQILEFFDGKIDILCPNQNLFNPRNESGTSEADIQDFKTHSHTWRYPGNNMCGGFFAFVNPLATVGIMRRILFWQQYLINSDGILFWNCCYLPENPWQNKTIPNTVNNINGNGFLIYPGYPIGQDPDTPIASLRLKQMLCGLNDYDYLRLVQEFIGENEALNYAHNILWGYSGQLCNIINKETGFHAWSCRFMREQRYRMGEALSQANTGHNFGQWTTAVVPDETHQGLEIRTCQNCGTQESRPKYCCEFLGTVDSGWNNLENWNGITTLPTLGDAVIIRSNCTIGNDILTSTIKVKDGCVLTIAGNGNLIAEDIVTEDGAQIIIEDGGQLYSETSDAQITVKKVFTPYENENESTGWYTISAPIATLPITTNTTLTETPGDFDLYRLDEAEAEWENFKDEANAFTTLDLGRGYLYAHNTESNGKQMSGNLNCANTDCDITYTELGMKGWNLIGNPFTHNIYKGAEAAIDDENLSSGYYVLDNSGAWEVKTYNDPIKPLQGILVQNNNTESQHSISINNTFAPAANESGLNSKGSSKRIEIQVSDGTVSDKAYIYLGEGHGLEKRENIDRQHPALYIRYNDTDFAIAHIDSDAEAIPLGFKHHGKSTYKISTKDEADLSYLHLIDNLTGTDTDLSGGKSYTFSTSDDEYEMRFSLVFKEDNYGQEPDSESYVYVNNNKELVFVNIGNQAQGQIINILGQVHSSFTISGGKKSIANLESGLYIIRILDGGNTFTQKIIVNE